MRRVLLASAAVLGFAAGAATGANAAGCYGPAELSAVQVRMLQSELMVGALACRDSNPELGMVAQYNSFVHRLGDRLVRHSKVLQAHFSKQYGATSRRELESFVTALANDASKRSMTSATYCQGAAELFRNVAGLEQRDLERFSATRAAEIGMPVASCAAETGLRSAPKKASLPAQ
jgi:hypothetical protein